MWYSVVNPRSPGVPNKVVASFATEDEAVAFTFKCEGTYLPEYHPHFVISTPTKPSIGEVIDPNDLAEYELVIPP